MANITANTSINSFSASKNYKRVIFEQGVPLADNVLNEVGQIDDFRLDRIISGFFGTGAIDAAAFQCVGSGLLNNFTIGAGVMVLADSPNGGLAPLGQICMCAGYLYSAQPLPSVGGVTTAFAALTAPSSTRADTVWLEYYEQDYGPLDDTSLYFANPQTSQNLDIAHRMKLVTNVQVWQGSGVYSSSLSITGAPFYNANHSYYPLAQLSRYAGQAAINSADLLDLRPKLSRVSTLGGFAIIASGNSSVGIACSAIKSSSRIFIQADPSLGGTAATVPLNVTARVVQNSSGGFTVALASGTAGTGGCYFSWSVTL